MKPYAGTWAYCMDCKVEFPIHEWDAHTHGGRALLVRDQPGAPIRSWTPSRTRVVVRSVFQAPKLTKWVRKLWQEKDR